MTMKRVFLITLLAATVFTAQAQKVWMLDECIDYALKHNLDLKRPNWHGSRLNTNIKPAKTLGFPP